MTSPVRRNPAEAIKIVASVYLDGLRARWRNEIARQTFHVTTALSLLPSNGTVLDIGGGLSLFSPVLASLGHHAVLVDDFGDEADALFDSEVLPALAQIGVQIIKRDVIEEGLNQEAGSFDLIASFESIEHWHHSPKRLFRDVARTLKPGGYLFLGAPNSVNLRKRITVPLGRGKWSQLEDWYEKPKFRGHVREPDLDDFRI